ncbi:MAG: PEP-CTERM sorting domain-containing protein [Bryobacteraceae bacterium]
MDTNDVSIYGCAASGAVPEPGTVTLLSMGLFLGVIAYQQRRQQRPLQTSGQTKTSPASREPQCTATEGVRHHQRQT